MLIARILIGFLVVALAVIWRRGFGLRRGLELEQLERQRMSLEAQRGSLEQQIRELAARGRLGVVAERQLGMRLPADSEVIVVPAPSVTRGEQTGAR
jgi:cell division protein FtsL